MSELIKELQQSSEHYELHKMMLEWFQKKEKKPKDVMAFLTAIWIGQMCLNGYSEDFVDKTLSRMKESWKNHRLNKENKKHYERNRS
jgi:late competence protein required for DNA uptake (superfamily II DNA/RNA helicase)